MKKIKGKLSFVLFILFLSSCSTSAYYQMHELSSPDLELRNGQLFFSDESVTVYLDFWSKYGDNTMLINNKTDQFVTILLHESFFIENGIANPFFQNSISSSTSHTQVTGSSSKLSTYYGRNTTSSYGSGSKTTLSHTDEEIRFEEKEILIPPKSSRFISGFNLVDDVYRSCDLLRFPSDGDHKVEFEKENSPFQFSSLIQYKLENSNSTNLIEFEYYIKSITNFRSNKFIESGYQSYCGEQTRSMEKTFKFSEPYMFYIPYGNDGSYLKH